MWWGGCCLATPAPHAPPRTPKNCNENSFQGNPSSPDRAARHVASVAYAGGLLGAAYHGIARPHVIVKGASGAIYAIMWSQLSLLALNWFEMPKRWLRLALIVLLFSCDAGIYWCERRPNLSTSPG